MSSLQEVARRAGVSPSTVSRAIARPETVRPATRERVLAVVRDLGYRPNELARSLRRRGSHSLGLIVTDLLNPFHATLAKGVQDAAERHGLTVFLFNSDESPEKERRALETLRAFAPQGLVIVPTARTRDHLCLLGDLPVVELDRASGRRGSYRVMVDNAAGAQAAVEHLISLGHRRIGLIVGQLDVNTSVERLNGYRAALARAGLPFRPALVVSGHHREHDGRAAAAALLSLPAAERPSALFVTNNEMTIGAVMTARERQLAVPGDLSIVGFDDSRWAQTMLPPVTVVAQPTYDLGAAACETLIALLRGEAVPGEVRLSTTLLPRASTAPPRAVASVSRP